MQPSTLCPLLLTLALVGGCAHAPPPTPPAPAPTAEELARLADADRAQLKAQSDAWDAAIVAKDGPAIEANMADDFRQIGKYGEVETRASFLEGLTDPDLTIDPYSVDDFEIRLYGDVALLTGRTRMTGSYQGQRFESYYLYTDTYVRRGGVWKVVSVQITGIRE